MHLLSQNVEDTTAAVNSESYFQEAGIVGRHSNGSQWAIIKLNLMPQQ